jgi:D-glycero-D-manno-heptose 1,7-bisphosphate phosphatase
MSPASHVLRPAVFLDRDGVINYNRSDYVKSWSEFEFLPGALAALTRLAILDWPVVVVTNQSAIGRGLVSHQIVDSIHNLMIGCIRRAGGRIDGVYYCPHHPDDGCVCRKPAIGLFLDAAARLSLDLKCSYLIGDGVSDVMAAFAIGSRPVLVKTGRGLSQLGVLRQRKVAGYRVAEDLGAAVDWILSELIRAPQTGAHK